MRADVNVSVRKPGGELGTRTETKNVNSVRFVMAVIEHEARRQVELIEDGGAGRAGNPPLRPRQERHAHAALQGRRARLSLLPRSRPAAARARRGVPRRMPRVPARTARRQAQALRRAGDHALQRARTDRRGRDRALVRGACSSAGGAAACRRANWVDVRTVRRAQPPGQDARRTSPVSPAAGRRTARAWSPTRRSVGQHRQADVRDHARNRRRRRRDRRERGLKQTSDTGAIEAEIDEVLAANADKVAAV